MNTVISKLEKLLKVRRNCETFGKSSVEALISLQVLLSNWIQIQKNSSNGLSWLKNIG